MEYTYFRHPFVRRPNFCGAGRSIKFHQCQWKQGSDGRREDRSLENYLNGPSFLQKCYHIGWISISLSRCDFHLTPTSHPSRQKLSILSLSSPLPHLDTSVRLPSWLIRGQTSCRQRKSWGHDVGVASSENCLLLLLNTVRSRARFKEKGSVLSFSGSS